jgi:hypothetical protein
MSDGSIDELLARAARYREMARTATDQATANSLTRLAERFEALAKQKEEDRGGGAP